MWRIRAGTTIAIYAPFGVPGGADRSDTGLDTQPWKAYTTREDKLYENHEVWDRVAVMNERSDVPEWAKRNIMDFGYVVIHRGRHYAQCRPEQIQYVD